MNDNVYTNSNYGLVMNNGTRFLTNSPSYDVTKISIYETFQRK